MSGKGNTLSFRCIIHELIPTIVYQNVSRDSQGGVERDRGVEIEVETYAGRDCITIENSAGLGCHSWEPSDNSEG